MRPTPCRSAFHSCPCRSRSRPSPVIPSDGEPPMVLNRSVAFRALPSRLTDIPKRLAGERSGASAIVVALAMTGLLGLTGLGTEVGMWYLSKRTMHGAADSASYSAATAKFKGANQTQWTSEAKSVAGSYSFVDGANNMTV